VRMKTLPDLARRFVLLCVVCPATAAFGCDQVPAGQTLWIRLSAPVSTYSAKVGDPVHAVLTQDLVCDSDVILPMGTPIEGVVRSKHKVGWGIRHETASLELEFNRAAVSPDAVTFTARVDEVENAREPVRSGVIHGIRSSNTFQGSINSRLIHLPTWNPYSDPVLIAYKAVFPIFPEPEIYYPAGTDVRLHTTTQITSTPVIVSPEQEASPATASEEERLDQVVEQLPMRVTTKKHVDADLLNVVFIGSEDQVRSAFHLAAWHNADPASKRAWMKNLYALLNNSGYAQQPMMTFLLNDKPEDMNWQKNLNSYGRRDHLRIWHWTSEETNDKVWVASSTHDTGAVLNVKARGFVHHIASDIDDERSAVIRDLNFAGCVKSVGYAPRPQMPTVTRNAIGDLIRTDGYVAVIVLKDCKPRDTHPDASADTHSYRPGNYAFRYIRRQILTLRNDIWRANVIYAAYDVGRMTFQALRHSPPLSPGPVDHQRPLDARVQPTAIVDQTFFDVDPD